MHQNGGEGSFKVIENVALLLVPNHIAKPFLEFTENGANKRKYRASGSSLSKNAFLIPEVRGI